MNPWATNTLKYKQLHCADGQRRYVNSGECEIEGRERRESQRGISRWSFDFQVGGGGIHLPLLSSCPHPFLISPCQICPRFFLSFFFFFIRILHTVIIYWSTQVSEHVDHHGFARRRIAHKAGGKKVSASSLSCPVMHHCATI